MVKDVYIVEGVEGLRKRRDEFINWSFFRKLWPVGSGSVPFRVVVLGAGPFGHALVELSEQADVLIEVPARDVHESVLCWAEAVAEYLRNKVKVRKVTVVSPWDYSGRHSVDMRADAVFWGSFVNKVRALVDKGHLVLVHGDMAMNGEKFEVMGGDYIAPLLAKALDFSSMMFVSNCAVMNNFVDKKVVEKIDVRFDDEFESCMERHGIVFWKVKDATGGMEAKVRSAFELVKDTGKTVVVMDPDGNRTIITRGDVFGG